jgi:hypothetical protein
MAAAVIGLAHALPSWAAALVVGAVVGLVGGALLFKAAYALRETDVTPRQTVETLKEDAQWVKEKMQ